MADIGVTRKSPGLGKQALHGFVGGATQSLGKQAGEAVGGLIGHGIEKLGEKIGVGGPDEKMLDLIVEKGLAKDRKEAKAWLNLHPRAQQADITANAADSERKREQNAYSKDVERIEREQALENEPATFEDQMLAALESGDIKSVEKLANDFEKEKNDERKAYEKELAPKADMPLDPNLEYKRERARGIDHTAAESDKQYLIKHQEPLIKDAKESYEKSKLDLDTSEEEKSRYKRIYNIATKEGLPSSQQALFARQAERALGLHEGDFNALLGAAPEEVTKILADTIREAKNYFGPRMTDFDLQSWFKRLPSLLNSPEGRIRALGDLYTFAELKELRGKAMKDIVKQHKGVIPLNINDLVDHKIRKQRNKLLDMFENGESNLPGFQKELKKSEKLSSGQRTAGNAGGITGAIGGGLLGALGGGASGAALGGKVHPGLGILGGLGGALGGAYTGAKAGYLGGSALGSSAINPQEEHPAVEAYRKAGKEHLLTIR